MGKRKLLCELSARQIRRKAQSVELPHELLVESCLNTVVNTRDTVGADAEGTSTGCNQSQGDDSEEEITQHTLVEGNLPSGELADLGDFYGEDLDLNFNNWDLHEQLPVTDRLEREPQKEATQETNEDGDSLVKRLRDWVFRFKIPLNAVTALLCILSLLQPNLPKDARSFLNTPRETITREVAPGEYWHRGLKKGLTHFLGRTDVETLMLSVNVDGLPIAESSSSVLWPILCSVNNTGVFIVGVYHGYEKPGNANIFLKDFVDEMNDLTVNGFQHNGKTISVTFKCLICDAPAKSFVLGITSHNARFACTKCRVEGEYLRHRMAYPNLNAPLRTDENFRLKVDEDYHKSDSILLSIPSFLPVTNVVLDYMHLVCEGVVKKLLLLWLHGPLTVRLSARNITDINEALSEVSSYIPKEFARNSRSLRFVKKWKATEFRLFILYVGIVVLKGNVSEKVFDNFVTLHIAISILCDKTMCQNDEFISYANDLLRHFVQTYMVLYGECFVSHNVHGLIHLAADVRNHGPLDTFSAFPFESFLFQIGTLLQKKEKPLQQIMRRYSEREENFYFLEKSVASTVLAPKLSGKHTSDTHLPDNCTGPQYMHAKFPSFELNISNNADCCCYLKDGSIVFVENFAHRQGDGEPVLMGKILTKRGALYDKPCSSSKLGIFIVRGSSDLRVWPLNEVKHKCLMLPTQKKREYAILPVLHTKT